MHAVLSALPIFHNEAGEIAQNSAHPFARPARAWPDELELRVLRV